MTDHLPLSSSIRLQTGVWVFGYFPREKEKEKEEKEKKWKKRTKKGKKEKKKKKRQDKAYLEWSPVSSKKSVSKRRVCLQWKGETATESVFSSIS